MSRVLLVEDDPDVSLVATEFLRAAGFEVVVADRVPPALAACRRSLPDAAIVDLHLPGESGWEFVRQARREWPGLALLLYTVHAGEPEVVDEARRLGVAAVVDKSDDPAALIEALRRGSSGDQQVSVTV